MICKFNHEGDCCNCSSGQYMAKCKPKKCDCPVPMTNYDRIKSMSVEGMAKFMVTHDTGYNMYISLNGVLYGSKEVAIEKNIQWLLQEVSEDE